jgi:biotin carboxylase
MSERLLLLASARTYRNQAFSDAARQLGLEVVLGLDVPPPFLARMPNCLALDYRDHDHALDAIQKYAAQNPVRAVLGVDDSGVVLAARAAEALGLPHNAPDSAEAAGDKGRMRGRFAAAGVPAPRFHVSRLTDDPEDVIETIAEKGLGFPCVLKPTRLSASKGVMRADDPQQFVERFHRLRAICAKAGCDEFIVETFFPGAEVALEGLLDNGQLHVLALFDKPDPLDGPFFEETIYVTPSRLPAEIQQAITRATEQACAALGLRAGPIHAEVRVSDPHLPTSSPEGSGGSLIVVEVAARSIGGLCSRVLRFAQNEEATLEELILRQACGLPLPLTRPDQAGGVMMIPIPGAGLLKAVNGVDRARRVPLIEDVEITAPLDNPLTPLPEGGDGYPGFIFARGESPEAVTAALREAHRCLHFTLVPEFALTPTASLKR